MSGALGILGNWIEMKFKDYLENAPIGSKGELQDVIKKRVKDKYESDITRLISGEHEFDFPKEIDLYCNSERCKSLTYFELYGDYEKLSRYTQEYEVLLKYKCRNCQSTKSKIALMINLPLKDGRTDTSGEALVIKFGQDPINREPTPNKVMKMIGSERDYFFRGLKAESLGLGIAAFAYYRRVIEHQKNRILDEILKAAEKLEAQEELIEQIKLAKNETQFSKSIDMIKSALPAKILIHGHNPLKLLYSALSEGLHNEDDGECLQLAKSIRLILSEFASNLHQINHEDNELSNAINELLSKQKAKGNA